MDARLRTLMHQAREHYESREYAEAEPILIQIVREHQGFADMFNMLGVIHHGHGRFTQAQEMFEHALEINPAYTEAALNLAVTYNDRGKYEKAREVYSRIKVGPHGTSQGLDPFARGKIANMHADVGQAYHDAGLVREAIGEFEKATALCPDFADLRTKPDYVPARLQLGVILLALGDSKGAEQHWQHVISIEPDNSQAKMYL